MFRTSAGRARRRARLLAAAVAIALPNVAQAEGFVLHMHADGALSPSAERHAAIRTFGADGEDDLKRRASARIATAPIPDGSVLLLIEETALRYAAHPALRRSRLGVRDWVSVFRANIEVESGYRQSSRSPAGAIGLGQLMPSTADMLRVDPADPAENLDGSARYLLSMLDRFGDPALALAAYNAGPHAVERHGGIPPYPETEGHVRKVLAASRRLLGETS